MIPITPLNDKTVLINIRSIERIEQMPETVLVLTGGRRMVVADLAQDVVKRIQRVHAAMLVMAAAGSKARRTSPHGDLPSTSSSRAALSLVESTAAPADQTLRNDVEQTTSTTNLLHKGQIELDRILAAIARCRWLINQPSMEHLYRRELGKALDAVDDIAGSLHPGQVHGATASLAEVLGGCRDQLDLLRSRDRDEMSVREADNIMRTVHASISKFRKIWTKIAADTSWPAIAESLESAPPEARDPKLTLSSG
jgi:flagellar protein FlbD